MNQSCLDCATYIICTDSSKSHRHKCPQFSSRTRTTDFDFDSGLILPEKNIIVDVNDLDNDGFDLSVMTADLLSQELAIPIDVKVDDRDMWRAPNFIEFCLDSRGLDTKPFIRQMHMGTMLLSEWCPRCSDTEWLTNCKVDATTGEFLDRISLLQNGICKCGAKKSELVASGELNFYEELAAVVGQRGGKTASTMMIVAYLIHIFLKMQRPNEVYSVLGANVFMGSLVALTFKQAMSNMWEPLHNYLSKAPWYRDYHSMLDHVGNQHGEEIYKLKDTFVTYKHRDFGVAPSGPDKRTLRGATRIFAALDELGWFDNKNDGKVKMNATEIHKALGNSLVTVRASATRLLEQGYDDIPTAFALNISSPSSARDKIIELYNASKGSKKIYGIKYATWDFNPTILRKDLDEAFRVNPVEAERDFGANPPLADSPFFGSFPLIEDCFKAGRNPIKLKYAKKRLKDGSLTRFAKIDQLRKNGKASVLSLDAGQCISGDNYIPTDQGLMQISQLGTHETRKTQEPLSVKVGGLRYPATSKTWFYSGKKETVKLKFNNGSEIRATASHKVLVLQGLDLVWVKVKNLKRGDTLIFNPNQVTRKTRYKLNLTATLPTSKLNNNLGKKKHMPKKPKYMTPDLAYLLGSLIAEGYYSKYYTGITNTNNAFVGRIISLFYSIFNLKPSISKDTKGSSWAIKGQVGTTNYDSYEIKFCSVALADWWVELGLTKGAKNKVIPECILQADSESQLAFIAAYMETDGSIRKDRFQILFWSASKTLRSQLQLMLGCHGVYTTQDDDLIQLNTYSSYDAVKLYRKIEKYLVFKRNDTYMNGRHRRSYLHGLPRSVISELRSLIQSRIVSKATNHKKGVYLTDTGRHVSIASHPLRNLGVSYEGYEEGIYTESLRLLRMVSTSAYTKLTTLFKAKYRFPILVAKRKHKIEDVYDLEIEKSKPPAFTANGIVVHNSNNSFAITAGHLEDGVPTMSTLAEVQPLPGTPLNFNRIYEELICPMIEELNVQILVSDRWQNIKLLHDAEEKFNIHVLQYSLRYDDLWMVRQMFYDGEVSVPRMGTDIKKVQAFDFNNYPQCFAHKPMEHLALQMLTVKDTGNHVLKGDNLTDDIFRAMVLGIVTLMDEENVQILSGQKSTVGGALAVKASRGQGGSGTRSVQTADGRAMGMAVSRRR